MKIAFLTFSYTGHQVEFRISSDAFRKCRVSKRLSVGMHAAGTGKTSAVLAIARQLYGKNLQKMTLELNASDDRGISVVRQEIQDFASTKSVFSSTFKLIVLDECDAMTKDAQFALRRVIEKYARHGSHIAIYLPKFYVTFSSTCSCALHISTVFLSASFSVYLRFVFGFTIFCNRSTVLKCPLGWQGS